MRIIYEEKVSVYRICGEDWKALFTVQEFTTRMGLYPTNFIISRKESYARFPHL